MTQLRVLRAIRASIPSVRVVKLELGNVTPDGESEIVVFTDELVFPFVVIDDEWADPDPLIEQITSRVNGEVT